PPVSTDPAVTAAASAWTTKAPMPAPRAGHATAVLKNAAGTPIVYVAGGTNATAPPHPKDVYAYNTATNTWTTKAPMPSGRFQPNGMGTINGKLYFAGGWKYFDISPSGGLFEYTPASNTWRSLPWVGHLSGSGAVGVIGGKLYMLTGTEGGGLPTAGPELDRYNPVTNIWTPLRAVLHKHYNPGAGVIAGKFYVVVGYDDDSNVNGFLDVYDPASNTWST